MALRQKKSSRFLKGSERHIQKNWSSGFKTADWFPMTKLGPAKALIPLMAVTQRSKGKVRPAMDFRELNSYIDTYTAKSDVRARWLGNGADRAKAYLQVCVDRTLWPYQTVVVKKTGGVALPDWISG
ncbi:LOW QUALITY PROTEIN: hypothetical protein M513_08696 [Trichuris suis]|uniref:Uncharacterized protein n=1 Tax=Trichuris suis TaxID=68888 RepID=A0A085LZS3_9BILA|nr:LOW QUALITY PROTEIN: hypothetical protein M513_08696 [Trichuris suis]